MEDRNGETTTFTYDNRHLLVAVTNALNETVNYAYRGDGLMREKVIDGRSTYRYEYDERGNLRSRELVELGIVTSYAYTLRNNLEVVEDPRGMRTVFGYDGAGRLDWVRDALGRITAVRYPNGHVTIRELDKIGRVWFVTDPAGFTTGYQYDHLGTAGDRITGFRKCPQYVTRSHSPTIPVGDILISLCHCRKHKPAAIPTVTTGHGRKTNGGS